MSTFVLLTVTGVGLGALYFLIASGLSLIYGLMGVLNFAHGAFLTVGAYAMWFTESKLGGVAVLPRFLLGSLAGLVVGAVFAALVELVLIRPLYRRHIEQVLVTVGLALATTALVVSIWGNDARPVPAPAWLGETTTVLGANIPNDRWLLIATALVVLFALNAFLRRTRYGLIIRAGVENRAMVTALGIDVRRAFTLVFAIGGVAAALAGVLSNVYFSTVDPSRGTSLLIFAFIVVVIGGLGLAARHRRRRGRRGPRAAVRELLRLVGSRRPERRPAARARPPRPSPRAVCELRVRNVAIPVVLFVALALVPQVALDLPVLFDGAINTPGTLQLLALCLVFGGLALTYDLLFGFTGLLSFGHALYFAVGVYLSAIAITKWHWASGSSIAFTALIGLVVALGLGAISLRVGGIAFAMVTLAFAQAGSILALKNPHGWTGGEEGLGVDYTKLPAGLRRHLQHEAPLLDRARLRRVSCSSIVRWAVNSSPGPRLAGDPRERVARRGARPASVRLQADVVRARVVPRDRWAASSTCCCSAARRPT